MEIPKLYNVLTIKALKTLMDNYQDVNDKFIYGLKPSSILQEEFTEIYKKHRHSSMLCMPPVNHLCEILFRK